MNVVCFNDLFISDFENLNKAWILKNFKLTEKDINILSRPKDIVRRGENSEIFFTLDKGLVKACCMAMKVDNGYEICYLASNEEGKKYGEEAFNKALEFALTKTNSIVCYVNESLIKAIHIIEKNNFVLVDKLNERDNLKYIYKGGSL